MNPVPPALFSVAGALDVALGLVGAGLVFIFFKSIIRVGVLNQRYQDPLAFWVGRGVLQLFRFRIAVLPGGKGRRNEIMTWYWPCCMIALVATWFCQVMLGFAMLNLALRAEPNFTASLIASGSALSTLGFATPGHLTGEFLAIIEGAIGLFIVVYLFTFLPGFQQLIHDRGARVEWIYARTGPDPAGVEILHWFYRNGRAADLDGLWEDWEIFFRDLAHARSFLSILCIVRPLAPDQSWVCAFGAFLDALALASSTIDKPSEGSRLCFEFGVKAVQNTHAAMRGTPISPKRNPDLMHVRRQEYDAACERLAAVGVPLAHDREQAWQRFIQAHMSYEEEIAWLASAISDPRPYWPMPAESK